MSLQWEKIIKTSHKKIIYLYSKSSCDLHEHHKKPYKAFFVTRAIPIKCFVSHRPVSCDGGSVGQAKKQKKNEHLKGLGSREGRAAM